MLYNDAKHKKKNIIKLSYLEFSLKMALILSIMMLYNYICWFYFYLTRKKARRHNNLLIIYCSTENN